MTSAEESTRKIASRMSQAASLLLRLIDQKTERDASGNLTRYWCPQEKPEYVRLRNGRRIDGVSDQESIRPWGMGDASALRSLATKGLIVRPRSTQLGAYTYAITEAGRIVAEYLYATDERQPRKD